MTIEKAMDLFLWNYGRAWLLNKQEGTDVIKNPVAWALHETWKKADEEGAKNDKGRSN